MDSENDLPRALLVKDTPTVGQTEHIASCSASRNLMSRRHKAYPRLLFRCITNPYSNFEIVRRIPKRVDFHSYQCMLPPAPR